MGYAKVYYTRSLHIEPHTARSRRPVRERKSIERASSGGRSAICCFGRPPCDADTHTRRKKPIFPQITHGNLYALSLPNQPPLDVSHPRCNRPRPSTFQYSSFLLFFSPRQEHANHLANHTCMLTDMSISAPQCSCGGAAQLQ